VPGQALASEPASMQATRTNGQHISNRFATKLPLGVDGNGRDVTDTDVMAGSDSLAMMDHKLLQVEALDASSRELMDTVTSSGGGTRTPDTRIMIPLL